MIWIKNIFFALSISFIIGNNLTTRQSYEALKHPNSLIHPTTSITNILRNGYGDLDLSEILELKELGIEQKNGRLKSFYPNDLDKVHETEHFKIHYTLLGNDAVLNNEYIYAMGEIYEEVWSFFIDSLNYDPPINVNSNTENLYKIYVENLPSFYFGVTYVEDEIDTNFSCTSFIKMRNNYSSSQFDEHTEIENIKVTAVHEFFHSIQFGYNCYEKLWLMEATAVWSEDQLYNSINDLYRYMPSWFSNPQKSLNDESYHMYGSFIFFQYISEHIGGRNTIRECWDQSRILANKYYDNSILAVDNALRSNNTTFNDTHYRMRVANLIMSNNSELDYYSYVEAEGYKTVLETLPQQIILFEKGEKNSIQIPNQSSFSCSYYKINTLEPIQIELESSNTDLTLTAVTKIKNQNIWNISKKNKINIDPSIDLEWISLIVPTSGSPSFNFEYSIFFKDGNFEDFLFYPPFPNPSYSQDLILKLKVITPQKININVYDILGNEIWKNELSSLQSEQKNLTWNKKDFLGKKVASGIYFIKAKGVKKIETYKVVIVK